MGVICRNVCIAQDLSFLIFCARQYYNPVLIEMEQATFFDYFIIDADIKKCIFAYLCEYGETVISYKQNQFNKEIITKYNFI